MFLKIAKHPLGLVSQEFIYEELRNSVLFSGCTWSVCLILSPASAWAHTKIILLTPSSQEIENFLHFFFYEIKRNIWLFQKAQSQKEHTGHQLFQLLFKPGEQESNLCCPDLVAIRPRWQLSTWHVARLNWDVIKVKTHIRFTDFTHTHKEM